MRWHRFTALAPAILLIGAVAAGAAVQAAGGDDPEPPRPAKPAQKSAVAPAPADGSRWKKTLPGGAAVELIGVSTAPPKADGWWSPDGRPLADTPFHLLSVEIEGELGRKSRTFAARVDRTARADDFGVEWEISGSSGLGKSLPEWIGAEVRPGMRGAATSFPAEARTSTVRVGLADGPWQTRGTARGDGVTNSGDDEVEVVFAPVRSIPRGSELIVAETALGANIRFVAVGHDGREQTPSIGTATTAGPFRMHVLEFGLRPDEVKEFRFLTRPYRWAEFRDVALEPAPSRPKP